MQQGQHPTASKLEQFYPVGAKQIAPHAPAQEGLSHPKQVCGATICERNRGGEILPLLPQGKF